MILRHATPADLDALPALACATWPRRRTPLTLKPRRLHALHARGALILVLLQDDRLAAAIAGTPLETDRGPGYNIVLLLADPRLKDPVRLLDAVTLYGCNTVLAQGRPVMFNNAAPDRAPLHYARDLLGMTVERFPGGDHQYGDALAIARTILERRPQWRM